MLLPSVDIVASLETYLPFESRTFNLVYANQTLEHISNLVDLIHEVYRVLKKDGLFIAHVPYFRSSWSQIDPTHVRSFTINSMDYFVKGTFCYENYRFSDVAFEEIEVFIDTEYKSTLARSIFTNLAIKMPFKFENSLWSFVYPFEQITYVLKK